MRNAGFLIGFALILVIKWDSLLEPPFWDTAMGLFPAAITLSATGFDLLGLLAMPGYLEGGPNVYGTSPVTLVTAVVFMLVGGGTRTLVVLHLLHFAVAAWALVTLFKLVQPSLGQLAAALLCLSALLHPTFSAQVGSMYMEVVLFLCAVSAVRAWTERRFWTSVFWGTLAWATKPTGIIVPAMLAAVMLLEQRPLRDKARRIVIILGLPALWTAAVVVLTRVATGSGGLDLVPTHDSVLGVGHTIERFLLNVPDLLGYLLVFFVAAAVTAPAVMKALRGEPTSPPNRNPEQRELLVMGASGLVIVFFVLLFLVALPVVAGFTLVLPRYYVVVLPFLLLWLGYAVKRLVGERRPHAPAALFAALGFVFAINTNGVLYPMDIDTLGPGNDPALTERSNAYKRLLALERDALELLQVLPRGVPIYYGHYEHYLLRYPNLGYARGPLPNGHNFAAESLEPLVTGGLPPCLYALFNYPWLGGEKILELIRFAESRPDVSAEIVRELRDERYVILLIRFQRAGASCPL